MSFGSRGVYCYDFNGKLIWEKDLGVQMKMRLAFGEGVAPLLVVIVCSWFSITKLESFIVALDKRNGKELWRATRDERSSWSTPLAMNMRSDRDRCECDEESAQLRSRNRKSAMGIRGIGGECDSGSRYQNGIVYVMSGYRDPKLMAIKLGKQGDLTGSDSIVWSHTRGVPYTASPVLYENKLYVVTDNGMVRAFNATTGEPYYAQTRLPKAATSRHHRRRKRQAVSRY